MGTRRRHTGPETGPKPVNGEKTVRKKSSQRRSTQTSSSRLSPTVWGLLLLLVLYVAGAVYVYNFVDVPQAIDLIQTRLATVMGYSEAGGPIPESPPLAGAPTPQGIKEPRSSADQPPGGSTESAAPEAVKAQATPEKKDLPKKNTKAKRNKSSITNSADHKIQDQLGKADDLYDNGQYEEAMNAFSTILAQHSKSPRAQYGKAQAINQMAEQKRSNVVLGEAIENFLKVLDLEDTPEELFIMAAKEAASRQTFRGWSRKALVTMQRVVDKYPNRFDLQNELGVKYLMVGANEKARDTFTKVLDKKPDDGVAMVHLGFIVKTIDNDPDIAIPLLQHGIDTGVEGTQDGRFYLHLGDAYNRMGQQNKSGEIYKLGVEKGLFRSKWQRSQYNVNHLVSRPWWTKQQTGNIKHLQKLEENWKVIRDEGLSQLDPSTGSFVNEDENLREMGDWKQFTLYTRGKKNEANCKKVPKTCALLEKFTDANSCSRGQIKYSVMHPGVHVWPHCGPTNCRVRSHLGLVVPDGPRIRVAEETTTWREGKFIIFDDSYEHEVWHDGDSLRLVLIIDMWHPDLSKHERATLPPI